MNSESHETTVEHQSTMPARRVLVADDDPAILRLLSAWLKGAGYEVQTALDGQQALEALQEVCPDFLVTDWDMPRIDGPELCRRVRSIKLPHYVFIFFVTAQSEEHTLVEGLEAGADDFLTKPIKKDELLARLKAAERVLTLERKLQQLARTDALTGLITQRTFYEILLHEWHRSTRYHLPLSCVMLDVDFFKRINDQHGHPAGDAVLKKVAELLRKSVRRSDCVARYGGEEFCVLLPETDSTGATTWAEKVRSLLHDTEITLPSGKQISVTASFGVAQRHDDTQTPEQLIDRADQALLCAKQSGRDKVVNFDSLCDGGSAELHDGQSTRNLFESVVARDIMTPMVALVREDTTIGQAAELFLNFRIDSAPVVNAEGKLVGILSEKDLMASLTSLTCWSQPVREVMKPRVITYEEDTPVRIIYEFLSRVSIKRVVIVKDDVPTGTVSRTSLLRWFRSLVLARGLVNHLGEEVSTGLPRGFTVLGNRQQYLDSIIEQLNAAASRLQQYAKETDPNETLAAIIGAATQIHGLAGNLLACGRSILEQSHADELSTSSLGSGYTE